MISNKTLRYIKLSLNLHQFITLLPYKMIVDPYFHLKIPIKNRWSHITRISILLNVISLVTLAIQLSKFREIDTSNVMFVLSLVTMLITAIFSQIYMIFSYKEVISLIYTFLHFNRTLGKTETMYFT